MSKVNTAKCRKCKNTFQYSGWSSPGYCSNCLNDINAEKRHKELMSVEKEKLKLSKDLAKSGVHVDAGLSNSLPASSSSGKKFHFVYFLFLGCGIGTVVACFIVPLLSPKGREFVARCYGYW